MSFLNLNLLWFKKLWSLKINDSYEERLRRLSKQQNYVKILSTFSFYLCYSDSKFILHENRIQSKIGRGFFFGKK